MKIGLVLSGGGVRGLAHVGLLHALQEEGIKVHMVAGSSAGALVGALYCAGYSPDEMRTFFKNTPVFKFSFYTSDKPGILDSEKYRIFFEGYFPEDDFRALAKPLFVSTTNLMDACCRIFSEGELIRPLLASAALPPLFSPVEIEGKWYNDGGVMNNFPVEPLLGKCDWILGSYCNPVPRIGKNDLSSTVKILQRVYDLSFLASSQLRFHHCQYLFAPQELYDIGTLDTRQQKAAYKIGYARAKEQMPAILKSITEAEALLTSA